MIKRTLAAIFICCLVWAQVTSIPTAAGGGAGTITEILAGFGITITNGSGPSTTVAVDSDVLLDYRCSATATGDTMTLFPGATSSTPCNFSFQNTVYSFVAPVTIVITAGSGADEAFVQVLPSGGVNVLSDSCTFDDNGYTSGTGTDWTAGAIHIISWTITGTDFDASGDTPSLPMFTRDNVTGTGGITCTPSSNVVVCSLDSSSTFDDDWLDMAKTRYMFIPRLMGILGSFANQRFYGTVYGGGSGNADNTTYSASEPIGQQFKVGASNGAGAWYVLSASLDPTGVGSFGDFVGTFAAFTHTIRFEVNSVSNAKYRFGVAGASATNLDATPVNFVGITLDTAVDGNFVCEIIDGGSSSKVTIAAATTGLHTATISATATGTLTCTIDATSANNVDTFPSFGSPGVNIGVNVENLEAVEKIITVYKLAGVIDY